VTRPTLGVQRAAKSVNGGIAVRYSIYRWKEHFAGQSMLGAVISLR
jgi:hypothetical protein